MDSDQRKAALRAQVRARLASLAPPRRVLEEELVTAAVQAAPEWQAAKTVALHKAVRHELSVVGLTNAAWRDGKRTLFPRVEGSDLAWHEVRSWRQLRPGAFGVPEPAADLVRRPAADVDLWIVPGVAFDAGGGRLGQGGGFYDRVLRDVTAARWGVGFDAQVVDEVPMEAHDVRLDRVVAPCRLGM